MKKLVIRVGIGAVVLLMLAALAVHLFLDSAIKRGVETLGPQMTKVDVRLANISVSLLSGSGSIRGLQVGNPEGFKSPHAIQVGSASLAVKPGSLFGDKVVIRSIQLDAPEITFEGSLSGNNLSRIQANVEEYTRAAEPADAKEEKAAARKLQVDDFLITNAKVNVSVTELGGMTLPVTIPRIHLTDLGTGPEGITPGELTKRVLGAVTEQATEVARGAVTEAIKTGAIKDAGKAASDALENAGRGVRDLFRKGQ
jgi:hypothetical protein